MREDYFHSHTRIFTYKGLIEALKIAGFTVEQVAGAGHVIPLRLFEKLDRRLQVRNSQGEEAEYYVKQ